MTNNPQSKSLDKTQVIEDDIRRIVMDFGEMYDDHRSFAQGTRLINNTAQAIQSLISDITTEARIDELEHLPNLTGELTYMGKQRIDDRIAELKAQPLNKRSK